jgi:hypothetical protein
VVVAVEVCESAPILDEKEERAEGAWLRIESGDTRVNIEAAEAVRIRDGLRRKGGRVEEQLATIIDAKAMERMVAPFYEGTVSVRIDESERDCLVALLNVWAADDDIANTDSDNLHRLLTALHA